MQDETVEEQVQEIVPEVAPPPVEDKQERNWREVNRLLSEQKSELELLRNQLSQKQAPEEPEEKYAPDDLVTYAQLEKLAEKKAKKVIANELQSFKRQSEQDVFISRNSDYEEAIKTYLPEILRENPSLEDAIKVHPRPWEFAYNTVKQSWAYRSNNTPTNPQAKKVLKNASTPASGNAISGSLKSKVDNFQGMTRQQVYEMSQKYIREGGR